LGTRVHIERRDVIDYFSPEDLEKLLLIILSPVVAAPVQSEQISQVITDPVVQTNTVSTTQDSMMIWKQ
jgi:hypothetical protein